MASLTYTPTSALPHKSNFQATTMFPFLFSSNYPRSRPRPHPHPHPCPAFYLRFHHVPTNRSITRTLSHSNQNPIPLSHHLPAEQLQKLNRNQVI